MSRLPIRVRLTAWYVLVLALILVAFAAAIYVTMRRSLWEQLDDNLENRALLTRELITVDEAGTPSLNASADNPEADDTFQRLLAPSGVILFDNGPASGPAPVEPDALAAAQDGATHRSTIDTGEGEMRVYSQPVLDDEELVGVLQVAQATDDIDETLDNLLLIFAFALPSALILAGAGGWWLSGRALAPVDRVTAAAREISGGADLGQRLNMDLPDDEVGRLARTFDDMLARLDAAFQRQRQFTADASHELRTPLTAIRGQVDVALERPRDEAEYRRVLDAVNAQVDRMTRLVAGLLMLARSDAGATVLHREPVELGDLVRSVAAQVTPAAERKGLTVQVDGDGTLIAYGDEDLLLQLMLNLADNAIKYTSEGSVTLGWRNGASPVMFVRDTGPGIPVEHQPHIFERFYRVDPSRAREQGGTGLGLAISRWIAEAHGGTLSLETSDAGSTFTLTLPAPQ